MKHMALLALLIPSLVQGSTIPDAADPSAAAKRECDDFSPFRAPFFGDLHFHTSLSMDTFHFQNNESDPTTAYRFARGESIAFPPFDADGNPAFVAQLDRPLDFAAVTDHAEFFGEVRICVTPSHPGYDSAECEALRGTDPAAFIKAYFDPILAPADPAPGRFEFCSTDPDCLEVAADVWQETRAAAIAADDPTPACELTTFIGYEWTANTAGANLHRNVIFANETVPEMPVSYLDTPRVEDLFTAIERTCLEAGNGCDAVIVPHNSNFSFGRMHAPETTEGKPFTAEQAARRGRLETLVEIIQHKGSSECRPGVGTTDELCAFESVPLTTLIPQARGKPQPPFERLSFVREALKEGLAQKQALGANPFELGFVGGTDNHSGAPGSVQEDSYFGHLASVDATLPGRLVQGFFNPGGLTVIWAEENSRRSLFDALRRREVYATSGTRPVVRFFGGFDLPETLCDGRPSFAALGYAYGVSMGSRLANPEPESEPDPDSPPRRPRFAVSALQDPGTPERPGARLERIQVVKGWVDEKGATHEVVHDVSVAKGGSGSPSLCTVWSDPDFDAEQPAFYYVRVLEVPTPRWHVLQCAAAGVSCDDPKTVPSALDLCCDSELPREIQERAWTSPIWYYPDAG